jgi:hypothetical protein
MRTNSDAQRDVQALDWLCVDNSVTVMGAASHSPCVRGGVVVCDSVGAKEQGRPETDMRCGHASQSHVRTTCRGGASQKINSRFTQAGGHEGDFGNSVIGSQE